MSSFFKSFSTLTLLLIFLFGIFLFISNKIDLQTSQYYSVSSSLFSIIFTIIFIKNNSKSWFFWFLISFFLFYQFGTFLTIIITGDASKILNVPTTFSNSPSESSQISGYLLSGCAIAFFAFLNLSINHIKKDYIIITNNPLLKTCLNIFYFTFVFVIIDSILQLKYASTISYASLYTSESNYNSLIPFAPFWKSLFNCSFYIIISTIPSKFTFKKVSIIFILITFIDSLKGGRGVLVINISLILWVYANFYNIFKINYLKVFFYLIFILSIIIYISFKRENLDFDLDVMVGIFSNGISTSQYHLAVYLDYQNEFITYSPFFTAPILFPIFYLLYGSKFIGQSEVASKLRFDLTHVMPSTLNHDAYLNGAGTGSAILSESIQYGLFVFIILILFFFLIYNSFIDITSNSILRRFISILFFMHVVISPRESISINLWGVLKYLIMFYCIRYLISPFFNYIKSQYEK